MEAVDGLLVHRGLVPPQPEFSTCPGGHVDAVARVQRPSRVRFDDARGVAGVHGHVPCLRPRPRSGSGVSCNDATGVRRRTSLGKRSLSDALASQIDATAPVLGDGHKLIHVEDAYAALGKEKKTNPYCSYPYCLQGAGNNRSVCGEGSSRTQAGRSKAAFRCPGPGCGRTFHPVCYMLYHRIQTERE